MIWPLPRPSYAPAPPDLDGRAGLPPGVRRFSPTTAPGRCCAMRVGFSGAVGAGLAKIPPAAPFRDRLIGRPRRMAPELAAFTLLRKADNQLFGELISATCDELQRRRAIWATGWAPKVRAPRLDVGGTSACCYPMPSPGWRCTGWMPPASRTICQAVACC